MCMSPLGRGQASDFSLVVDVERFGQVQGRASDQAVEVAGRPVFPQHRGQGVALAVGVVSDGLAPRVDYVGVAAGGAAGGRKVPHGAVRPEEPVVCLVAYEVDSEPSGCRS
jgi:hypothetical protein